VIAYLARRLLSAIVLILVVSSGAFVLTRMAPDVDVEDPFHHSPDAQVRPPLAAQYAAWLGGAVRLDLGRSSLYSRPVWELVRERAVNTTILAAAALLLATLAGIPLGAFAGGGARRPLRRLIRAGSLVVLSVPPLVGSLVLVLVAARTGWLPIGGMSSDQAGASWWPWLADVARHLPVPALALALPLAATLERLQAQAVSAQRSALFVTASRARGLAEGEAIRRHAWRASLAPVLGVYGVMIGSLFSGSFVVEVVTSWPGLGRLMVDALRARDLYLVAGAAAAGATCLAAGTLVADWLRASVDPRVGDARS
jgi:peptide/nickel transport system permease protein